MELELEAGGAGGRTNRVVTLSGDAETAELGRGDLGPAEAPPADRTVSRRHVSLRLLGGGDHRVAFEVVGRNPVVVRSADGNRVYRRGEAGELRAGDGLSLSLKAPSFWAVRRTSGNGDGDGEGDMDAAVLDAVARRERLTRERKERERERERRAVEEAMEVTDEEDAAAAGSGVLDAEVEVEDLKFDVASIDPVREFGFLSMGHEFDNYQRGRIRPPKDWNWFLEEIRGSSDDEDDEVGNEGGKSKGSRGAHKKKKEGESEDEAWTGESEDEKDSLSRGLNVKRPKHVTRSKDPKKPRKENSKVKKENNDDGDEEDETLGGFIVNEEDEPMEELSGEEEEEEEFDDEDDDD